MRGNGCQEIFQKICVALGLLFLIAIPGQAQNAMKVAASSPPVSEAEPDIRVLADLIHDLQAQVQTLNSKLSELRAGQQRATEEAHELRRELDLAKARTVPVAKESISAFPTVPPAATTAPPQETATDRLNRIEEDQQLLDAKITDQYQTKVESGSRYRVRLSGIVLLNLYDNRGTVDNQDFPEIAQSPQSQPTYVSPSSFGGSLRQSQIRLQAFGPDFAGARTSADIHFDFAGGFPNSPNGVATGLVRLRTGTVRLDWANTSIIAGQDRLFFAPLAPTSLATLAIPALSYAGNLWSWTPQARVEQRFVLSESSSVSIQAGILDSLTGDTPVEQYERYPSWGEQSGQPAFATRASWTQRAFGQNLTLGFGGYYNRQNWGFDRIVKGWAATMDLTLPLGKLFEFSGEFYRGRAVAGLGGGIGQSVLFTGSISDPATIIKGLDSMGGWTQLKFKPKSNLEFNAAIGLDNPFAHELRSYDSNPIYQYSFSRNLSPLVNFIYQLRSDVLFSAEYRRLQTGVLDNGSYNANHVNLSVGYIF